MKLFKRKEKEKFEPRCLGCNNRLGVLRGAGLICDNKDCSRYGLITGFYKDWNKEFK